MVETEEECQFCGGCEEVDVQLQAGGSDVVACPACMARDKNQAIARRDAEIERLLAALKELREAAEHDMKMNQGGDEHEDESEGSGGWWSTRTHDAIEAARADEQNGDK